MEIACAYEDLVGHLVPLPVQQFLIAVPLDPASHLSEPSTSIKLRWRATGAAPGELTGSCSSASGSPCSLRAFRSRTTGCILSTNVLSLEAQAITQRCPCKSRCGRDCLFAYELGGAMAMLASCCSGIIENGVTCSVRGATGSKASSTQSATALRSQAIGQRRPWRSSCALGDLLGNGSEVLLVGSDGDVDLQVVQHELSSLADDFRL